MSTIKLNYLPNGTRIMNAVRKCTGDVFLTIADNTIFDLKKDAGIGKMISAMNSQSVNFSLSYSEPKDTSTLFGALV